MFGRRRRNDAAERSAPRDESLPAEAAEAGPETGEEPPPLASPDRPNGPWDVAEVALLEGDHVDLGGLLAPALPGLELRAEVAEDRVLAVTMVLGNSAVQVQPFAAPRTLGIWEEVRTEIAAGITQQGGLVDQAEGPFGSELRAQVPVHLPDGQQGVQAVRFLGVDGPRWFLRGVVTGEAAVEPEKAGPIEEVFRAVVVVRGGDPMAPRDPIPLKLPRQPAEQQAEQQAEQHAAEQADQPSGDGDLNPFRRGPEITEIR